MVLDVGCGTGFFAEKISYRRYIGIDSDPKVIQVAAKRGLPHAQFILADCGTFAFETLEPRPTLAVLFGILHHLDDAESERLLTRLGNLGVRSVVTLDPVYSRFHVLNNALCGLDRGRFVRTEKEMTGLVARSRFLAEEKRIAYSNTKIAKYILFRLKDTAGEKWLFL